MPRRRICAKVFRSAGGRTGRACKTALWIKQRRSLQEYIIDDQAYLAGRLALCRDRIRDVPARL
jgi:hypothetical protein